MGIACRRTALDRRRRKTSDANGMAQKFEQPKFLLACPLVGGHDLASEGIGGLPQPVRQCLFDLVKRVG